MKFLLIFWLYQSTGFSNTIVAHIAVEKVEMVDKATCEAAAKVMEKSATRGNDIIVNTACVPMGD